jgi:predicted ATPase/class 3 adenylate cyclase
MTMTPGPPTGLVTCLFSDIEGSTRIELALGTGPYREVRERHRELLRAAFLEHAGYEVSTEGDSFFVIFRRASDAVRAAIDAQRAVTTESWPSDGIVRVRMGIHTGEVEELGGDVIGYTINRTARIAAVAHGGQVLLSDATRGLVADDLPAEVTLRDLGAHRLKDLREAEHLVQLVIEGLADTFPPLRSLDARPNNLPTQLTSFVGRERELVEAAELLRGTRLLSLTGPGGTGKSRLSLQVAATTADDYPDGVWFVELDAVRDAALVAPTIARTLGVADNLTRTPVDMIAESIGNGHVLLVLDNFEQVVEAGRDVAGLLRRCPNVRCLVTTRIALHVSGEQEYPVPGLPAPPDTTRLSEVERLNLPREIRELDAEALNQFEAVRLFIARASLVRPGFTVTNANAPAVAGISARLHGMPLAIELAAARVKLLTPDQILARLEHHLAVLTAGSRDVPERQQTLRGAIAWSYDLLDDGARRLLDRLSVFRGGFDLEMAEQVCGPADEIGGDVLDRIGELVDQSLVRPDDIGVGPRRDGTSTAAGPRFTMLETIREFANEMLQAGGEAEAIGDRHAAAMLAFAQRAAPELSGADQRTWLERLEGEHDNMRAALDWSISRPDPVLGVRLAFALWRFWQQRGYLNEARARFDQLDAQGWKLEPVDRARFAEAYGGVGYWQSDVAIATRYYNQALELWRDIGDQREIANALFNRAYADMVVVMGGNIEGANLEPMRAMLEEALALYRELGDAGGEGNILWALGSFNFFTGDAAAAESWYRRSLELHRKAANRTMEAWSLHMLALSAAGQRHFEEAGDIGKHALRHFFESGDVSGMILVLDDLAIVAVGNGDDRRGGVLWGAARHLQRSTGTALADYVDQNNLLYGVPTPRDVLSPEDLERYTREGESMSLDEVVAYALDLPSGVPPDSHVEVA